MRQTVNEHGERVLVLCDRFEWERETRFTARRDGQVFIEILVQRTGIFDTSETYLVRREEAGPLGAWLMAGARLRERQAA